MKNPGTTPLPEPVVARLGGLADGGYVATARPVVRRPAGLALREAAALLAVVGQLGLLRECCTCFNDLGL